MSVTLKTMSTYVDNDRVRKLFEKYDLNKNGVMEKEEFIQVMVDILKELGAIAEGVKTSQAVCALSDKLGIETPLNHAVYEAVYTDTPHEILIEHLMNRKFKSEEMYKLKK